MTEVALALVTAFFSIMVLSLVFVGAGMIEQADADVPDRARIDLVQGTRSTATRTPPSGSARKVSSKDIIIFDNGQYMDGDLRPVAPDQLSGRDDIVLALRPGATLSEALAAMAGLSNTSATVTTLDEPWLKALIRATQ
jgi:hypothetical protein